MIDLTSLPLELLLDIADAIPQRDLSSLARANKRLYGILNPRLYQRDSVNGQCSALFWAAKKGEIATARLALDAGADINVRAAASQAEEATRLPPLFPLFHHFSLTAIDTPLVTALYYHRATEDAMPVLPETGQGTRANQHHMFIRFLISRGVDVNCPSGSGLSPLGFTVLANADIKLMRMLLESGADPCVNDPLGTPLGHLLFASYVLGNGSYTAEKYRDVLKLLLEHGLDPNSTNRPGRTLLNGAIHLGKTRGLHVSMETARLLLQHGADVNAKDPDGMTPLHRLLVAGSESVPATAALAKLLIQNGAEPGADLEVSRLFRELRDIWPRPPSSAA